MSTETPPGWYPAPDASDLHRYWDGEMWTEQARPAPRGRGGPNSGVTGNPTLVVQTSEIVAAALEPDEHIEAGFHVGRSKQFFVATDRRIVVIKRKGAIFREKEYVTNSIGYDEVESIGLNKWGVFELRTADQHFTSGSQHVGDFLTFVRSRLVRSGPLNLAAMPGPAAEPPTEASVTAASSTLDDDSMTDELERLVKMFADGFLTEAEFALAKSKLLEG